MRFLLRITFWLGLVLVLLPRDKTPESEKLPQIGAADAVQAATAAVSDMTQFCKRQPTACEVGGQAATIIGQRAQDGAKKIYQIINDKKEHITNDKNEKLPDLQPREWASVLPLCALAIAMGVFPSLFLAPMELSVKKVVERVQTAQPARADNEIHKAKDKMQIVKVAAPSVR